MEFDSNKPIYLQIVDVICEKILSGELSPGDRVLSVREYAAEIGVNPNTVARSFEKLTDMGVIYTKRGLGYYVAGDARNIVLAAQRVDFMENELPRILKRMKLLGIKPNEILI